MTTTGNLRMTDANDRQGESMTARIGNHLTYRELDFHNTPHPYPDCGPQQ